MSGLKRRWWAAVAAAALVIAASWLLLGSLLEPVDETWARIQETGVLRICTDPSWPPFESLSPETAQVEGFDIDLARLLAERMLPGLRVEVV